MNCQVRGDPRQQGIRSLKWGVSVGLLVAATGSYWLVQAAEDQKFRELKADPAVVEFGKTTDGRDISLRPITVLKPVAPCKQFDNCYSPEKVKLGAMLFFDTRLSGDASTACVKCHHPTMGWGESGEISVGYPGTSHFRNSHSAMNTGRLAKYFWEGRTLSLEAQAGAAAFGGSAGNVQPDMAQARLMQVPEYRQMFQEIFGGPPHWENISRAIAAFQRHALSSEPAQVPFERYLMGDDKAISEQAKKGMQLFAGKARCIMCHNGEVFTDEDHHSTALPRPESFGTDPLRQIEVRFRARSNGVSNYAAVDDDLGAFLNEHRKKDVGRNRTQPLLEIKYTAPYMHNGTLFTLEEVVDFYNKGGGEDQFGTKSPLLKPLNLAEQEQKDLVAFLDSLSGDELPAKEFMNPKLPPYGNTSPIAGIN